MLQGFPGYEWNEVFYMQEPGSKKILRIEGMVCASCESRLESAFKEMDGVSEVKASLADATLEVTYDAVKTTLSDIIKTVEGTGYNAFEARCTPECKKGLDEKARMQTLKQFIGAGIVLCALYLVISKTMDYNFMPNIDQSMGYGILFVVGLFTSIHCIAMCGGINLSQCMVYTHSDEGRYARLKPGLLYNAGRMISYSAIGGIVGALGSVLSFTGMMRGIVAAFAGIFMMIMGLNLLDIFPWLKKINPRLPKRFRNERLNGKGHYGPFYVGLLNGLMPCGPLQAMQLYALGTGNALMGAISMFMFSAGTVPLMFGFSVLSLTMSGKFNRTLMKVSALLVVILGIIMLGRGLSLSGIAMPEFGNSGPEMVQYAEVAGNVQMVSIDVKAKKYAPIVVQKGIPVHFIINAKPSDLNSCNGIIAIPKYDIEKTLQPGENVIEFVPQEIGDIPYSCKMGMIKSKIRVVDDVEKR